MTSPNAIDELDLNAYVDGELADDRVLEVESWLATHPEDAAKVHAYKLQNIHIKALYDNTSNVVSPLPIEAELSKTNSTFVAPSWMKIAAALVLLVGGGLSGWGLHSAQSEQQVSGQKFVKQALDAHVVFVSGDSSVKELAIASGGKPSGIYSRHLNHSLRVPNIAGAGFKLTGGRLLKNNGLSAAQFMYKDAAHRMVTLYVQSGFSKEDMTFRLVAENDMVAFYWTDGPLGYALTGSMKRGDLLDLARMVYEKLRR